MDIEPNATEVNSILTGIAVVIPVAATQFLDTDQFHFLALKIFIWLCYFAAILYFVFGQQRWESFRWVPVDGMEKVFLRSVLWLLGGMVSLGIFMVTNAI